MQLQSFSFNLKRPFTCSSQIKTPLWGLRVFPGVLMPRTGGVPTVSGPSAPLVLEATATIETVLELCSPASSCKRESAV